MSIDFSKKPEGATHFYDNDGPELCYYKEDWYENKNRPPVGTIFESLNKNLNDSYWIKSEMIFVGRFYCVYTIKGGEIERCVHKADAFVQFRPIKSDRDKAIEEMSRIILSTDNGIINDISLGAIYDAGFRLPESK